MFWLLLLLLVHDLYGYNGSTVFSSEASKMIRKSLLQERRQCCVAEFC